jgi:hypothetical protein
MGRTAEVPDRRLIEGAIRYQVANKEEMFQPHAASAVA